MIRACPDSAPQRERINNELAQDAIKNGMVTGRKFGMKIKNTMEEQNGRVLPAPQLEYGMKGNQRETCAPRDGAWDTRGKKFLVSGTCSKWIVINFNTRTHEKDVGRFCQELSKWVSHTSTKLILVVVPKNESPSNFKDCWLLGSENAPTWKNFQLPRPTRGWSKTQPMQSERNIGMKLFLNKNLSVSFQFQLMRC